MTGAIVLAACHLVHVQPTRAAYPMSPITIREQATEADVIVFATVELDPSPPDAQPTTEEGEVDLTKAFVVLKVQETWKGAPRTAVIHQRNCYTQCDAMRYMPGTHVVAFLDGPDSHGAFKTRGLEYGYRMIQPVDADVLKQRIAEFQSAARIADRAASLRQVTECLVRCAEHPVTRWDGACDLNPDRPFNRELTKDQQGRLLEACLGATGYDRGGSLLVDALKGNSDPRILAWLVSMLRKCHENEATETWSSTIVIQIAERESRPEVDALATLVICAESEDERR